MEDRLQRVKHYAILIGINDYPERPLMGCVRDIQEMKAHLISTLPENIHIQELVSQAGEEESCNPCDSLGTWPSYENIVKSFEVVTSSAQAGDFVYIHYSGHGTRKPPCGDFSNQSTGDLAFVLLSHDKKRVAYLWGYELAQMVKAMVDKSLIVTLVLDCCFSASAYRDDEDFGTRFLPYDNEVPSKHHLDLLQELGVEESPYRDASALPNWLISPDRYATFTACGPQEFAIEPKFDGQRRGIMSYFLLQAIKKAGLTSRVKDIHDHVRAKILGTGYRKQNPIFYGNPNQGFFGKFTTDGAKVAIPVVMRKDSLELQAGQAHGFEDGDQFILYPVGNAEDISQEPPSIFRASCTRALTSDLKALSPLSAQVKTGWTAEPITRLSLQKFPVHLASNIPDREAWVRALDCTPLSVEAGRSPCAFMVECNELGEYKITEKANNQSIDLPSTPKTPSNINQLSDILEHLVRYELAKSLHNLAPTASFEESYAICLRSGGKENTPGAHLTVRHNAIIELLIQNRGEKVLYASIYSLGPAWQVKNVYQGSYAVVTTHNERERFLGVRGLKLRMRVPDSLIKLGRKSCRDIIKVFITARPTSFDMLELPSLGEEPRQDRPKRNAQCGEGSEDWNAVDFTIFTTLE